MHSAEIENVFWGYIDMIGTIWYNKHKEIPAVQEFPGIRPPRAMRAMFIDGFARILASWYNIFINRQRCDR